MTEVKEAWSQVGARVSGLGERLKEHLTQPPLREVDAVPDQEDARPAAPSEAGALDALKDAFRSLGEALDSAVDAIGSAARDPAVANEFRDMGQAFVNAVSATFSEAGEELKKAFGRGRATETVERPSIDAADAADATHATDDVPGESGE